MSTPVHVRDDVDTALNALEIVLSRTSHQREENDRLRAENADLRTEVEHLRRMQAPGAVRTASEILAGLPL